MLKQVHTPSIEPECIPIGSAHFPAPFASGLEYSSPARGSWNIVHTGMLIPEAHEIFVCAASCLRGVVLTAAEMGASHRFSTIAVREENLLDGNMEELIVDGVADILSKLPKRPPAVLVYTSCVHHFAGCDLPMIYSRLRERFPDIDFTDCYMNPILRKSGLTPDQIMRSRLYSLLYPRPRNEKAVAIIGNDLPTDEACELLPHLRRHGFTIHEITSCRTYREYQRMAESAYYISYYPAAVAGGNMLEERLGGKQIYLPFSFDPAQIDAGMARLCDTLGIPQPDPAEARRRCAELLQQARTLIGSTPIAIDYTYCPRPLGLARMLLEAGFRVERVYADSFTGEEAEDFAALQRDYPTLALYPTVHPTMRFHAARSRSNFLAIGQKAAYFTNTDHFVNVIEGGGLIGYAAIEKTLEWMCEAFQTEKDMKALVQRKGMGCGGCI